MGGEWAEQESYRNLLWIGRMERGLHAIITVALEVASKHCTLVGFAHYTSAGCVVIH